MHLQTCLQTYFYTVLVSGCFIEYPEFLQFFLILSALNCLKYLFIYLDEKEYLYEVCIFLYIWPELSNWYLFWYPTNVNNSNNINFIPKEIIRFLINSYFAKLFVFVWSLSQIYLSVTILRDYFFTDKLHWVGVTVVL